MTQYIPAQNQDLVWITFPTRIPVSVLYPTVHTMYNEYGMHKKMLDCIAELENNWSGKFANYTSNSYVFEYHYVTIHLVIGDCEQTGLKTVTMQAEYDVKQKYGNTVDYLVHEQVQEMYKSVCSIFCKL